MSKILHENRNFIVKYLSMIESIKFLYKFKQNSINYLSKLMEEEIDIRRISIRNRDLFLMNHPEIVETVLHKEYLIFEKTMKGVELAKGTSIVTSTGDKIRQKMHVARPKLSKSYFPGYLDKMKEIMQVEIERLDMLTQNNKVINLHWELEYILLRLIGKIFFSKELDETHRILCYETHKGSIGLKRIALSVINFPKYIPSKANKEYLNAKQIADEFIKKLIDERISSTEQHDDLLNDILNEIDEKGNPVPDEYKYNHLFTLLPASFETPAKALSFTINEILRNEKIMSNLFDEFNQMGKYQTISVNDLENATYLHGCLKEALRLYPPIWLQTRKNNEEVIIDNVHIPKGSIILMPQYMIHRDPKYWEHPNEFRPERFLQEKPLKHPFSFFPFGGGPSRCVGNQFAFQMIPLVIHNLLTEFDIQLLDKNKPIRIETGITMYPKDGLNVIMKRKLNDTLNNNKPNKGKDNKIILEKEIIE